MKITKTHLEVMNNCNELFDICNNTNQPIFITKDGKPDLVALSVASYLRLCNPDKEK